MPVIDVCVYMDTQDSDVQYAAQIPNHYERDWVCKPSLVKMLKEKYFLLGLFVKMYDTCTLSDIEISLSHIDMKVSLTVPRLWSMLIKKKKGQMNKLFECVLIVFIFLWYRLFQ